MPKVPGTFKNQIEGLARDFSAQSAYAESLLLSAGALYARRYTLGQCSVMVAREPSGPQGEHRWHLSIAHQSRYPTWDEIKTARYTAPELVDVPMMAQLLPKLESDDEWVNVHENAFHLHEVREEASQ